MSQRRAVLSRILIGVLVWAAFLVLTGEFRPGGAFTLYTGLLVVFLLQQLWSLLRGDGREHRPRA